MSMIDPVEWVAQIVALQIRTLEELDYRITDNLRDTLVIPFAYGVFLECVRKQTLSSSAEELARIYLERYVDRVLCRPGEAGRSALRFLDRTIHDERGPVAHIVQVGRLAGRVTTSDAMRQDWFVWILDVVRERGELAWRTDASGID